MFVPHPSQQIQGKEKKNLLSYKYCKYSLHEKQNNISCLRLFFVQAVRYFLLVCFPRASHLRSGGAMLLAKLKELKTGGGGGGDDAARPPSVGPEDGSVGTATGRATTSAPPTSSTSGGQVLRKNEGHNRDAATASSSSLSSGVGATGWAKTRVAGTKAARQQIRDNRGLQTEPDGAIRRLRGHAGPVHCLVLSPPPNQTRLYSGGRDGTVRAWDHLEADGRCVLVMSGHKAAVCALAVDPSGGKRLYSAGADNTVRVWMLTDGSCLRSTNLFEMTHADDNSYFVAPQRAYSHSFTGKSHKVYGMSLSRDGARCFAGCSDKDVKVWDVKTGTLRLALKGHEGPVGAMAAFHTSSSSSSSSQGGGRLLTGSGDATMMCWDLDRNRCDCVMEGHSGPVLAVCISSDNRRVYSASSDNSIRVWEVTFAEGGIVGGCKAVCMRVMHNCHRGNIVRSLAITTAVTGTGNLGFGVLFSGGEDNRIRAWRGTDSEALCSLKGHGDWISDLVLDDTNSVLCSASHDGSILVWRVGKMIRKQLVFSEAANVFLDLRK